MVIVSYILTLQIGKTVQASNVQKWNYGSELKSESSVSIKVTNTKGNKETPDEKELEHGNSSPEGIFPQTGDGGEMKLAIIGILLLVLIVIYYVKRREEMKNEY